MKKEVILLMAAASFALIVGTLAAVRTAEMMNTMVDRMVSLQVQVNDLRDQCNCAAAREVPE